MQTQHHTHEHHLDVPQLAALDQIKEIEQQIATLQQQAEQLLQHGRNNAIASVKSMIAAYHLKPEEVGFQAAPRPKQAARPARAPRAAKPPKYKDPESGKTWTGQGNEPLWMKDKDRAAFLIHKPEALPPAAALPPNFQLPHGQAMP